MSFVPASWDQPLLTGEYNAGRHARHGGDPAGRHVAPGRYFRLLFISYSKGLSSECGIARQVAASLSLRTFLDLDICDGRGAGPPDAVAHATADRHVETHVFTWVLEWLADAGLVRGKTVGIDATTLEANAAMRSIERRDTGESYEAFVRRLAEASGVGDTDASGFGSVRPLLEAQEDVEQGVAASAVSGREDREDEGVDAAGRSGGRGGGGRQGRATTATRRWWRSARSAFGVTYRSRSAVGAAGDAAGEACCAAGIVVCEPALCPGAAGSSRATPPPRVGGAVFRAPVRDRGHPAGAGAGSGECPQARAHPGGRLQLRAAAAPPDRRGYAPEPARASFLRRCSG